MPTKTNKLPDQASRLNQAFVYLKSNGIIKLKKEMAARLEIHEQHFSRLLRGDERVTHKTAAKIEKEFGIPALWITDGVGKMVSKRGVKITSTENYIADNVIYHIPYESISILSNAEIDLDKLNKWCIPGLKGTYLSVSIPNNNFEPDIPSNSILIIKEVSEQQPETFNVLIIGGKIFFTDKIKKADKVFSVVAYVPKVLI